MADLPPIAYLDTSALVKLIVPEPESDALRAELAQWRRRASSALTRTELIRACTRVDDRAVEAAYGALGGLSLMAVTDAILDQASRASSATLRPLDAIHLATALALRDALGAVVTYNERLAAAARSERLPVTTPA